MNITVNATEILFKTATTDKEFTDAKNLFIEYANSLETDLCFQNFSKELETIHEQYNKPGGVLFLAYKNDVAIGCVGVRRYNEDVAELKRMYVQPQYRKYKIGKELLQLAIAAAKALQYKKIKLDTLPDMQRAQELYRSFGFNDTTAYRYNPVPGTIYMEIELVK